MRCGKKYQTSDLSHSPGGWDVEVKMIGKEPVIYPNIKSPRAYAKKVIDQHGSNVERIKKLGLTK